MVGKGVLAVLFALTCSFLWPPASSFWFFTCRHGNGNGDVGDPCSVFCRCRTPNTCEAGVQRCVSPGQLNDACHMTRPCSKGLSCHPGVQKCYHVPRRLHEPCVAGFGCARGLTCHPGIQVCYHVLRQYNEPCAAGFPCGPELSCQPGFQRCLHLPRREGERCFLGFECDAGLECRMCGEPYLTCQMSRVPNMDEEFYHRAYNKVAFLVTHNSFTNSVKYALWVRNQRVSVTHQLKDGVRGLMLDIYPGWGNAEVRLCHGNCFWGGSSNLLDTLVEVRSFLEDNPRDVITIIFEDYVRNPTILSHVFDQSRLSKHVLRHDHWGSRYKDWPTLMEMRTLGRLVVLNNVGLNAFPYTTYNMWYDVRENRYGREGLNTKTCIDRGESTYNAGFNTNWSLVLVNWFGTLSNPLDPCLNSFTKLKQKLVTCQKVFGQLANFLAVDFYHDGEKGGAFRAVEWLNEQWEDQHKVRSWRFDIMKALNASQSYRDSMRNIIDQGSNQTRKHTKNFTDGVTNRTASNPSTDKRVTLVHNITNLHHDHVINKTKHWTNVTHHVTTANRFYTNHNGTNQVVNTTDIYGSDHVMNMTSHQMNMTNHVTNKNETDHVQNTTYYDGTFMAEHVGNLTNHVLNSTDTTNHVTGYTNVTSYPVTYDSFNNSLNGRQNTTVLNYTNNITSDNLGLNSTLRNTSTFKDSTRKNSGMALSSALTNDRRNITKNKSYSVTSQNTSSQRRDEGYSQNSLESKSSLPGSLGKFSLEINGSDFHGDEVIQGNKYSHNIQKSQFNEPWGDVTAQGDQKHFISKNISALPATNNITNYNLNNDNNVSLEPLPHDMSNGVELRRGFHKVPLHGIRDGTQSLEEYIDEI